MALSITSTKVILEPRTYHHTMGSCSPNQIRSFPNKDSEGLILTHPTPSERNATWTLNANNWGKALGLDNYLEREEHLLTAPLAENGGITHWILVDGSLPENERQILSSCESLRKPALIAKKGTVREVITHGIGSVFTQEECRGRGYAGRMLRELGPKLKTHQVKEARKESIFSILYSDIGKKFYAKHGWQPFPSTHGALFCRQTFLSRSCFVLWGVHTTSS